jgi:hypothetical protein
VQRDSRSVYAGLPGDATATMANSVHPGDRGADDQVQGTTLGARWPWLWLWLDARGLDWHAGSYLFLLDLFDRRFDFL